MHHCPMDSQSSSPAAVPPSRPSYKRRRSAAFASIPAPDADASSFSGCATSGESSGDESDSSAFELESDVEQEAQAAKRRRRADLDGIKKSVRQMEAQVVDASAQLRDLAALVALVVARRQQQLQLA